MNDDRRLSEGMRRLVDTYGKTAVRRAALAQTGGRRGPKTKRDLLLLLPYLQQDAIDWLGNREPRKNHSIAREIAHLHPGHNERSTITRIERYLRKERGMWRPLLAYHLSTGGPPLDNPSASLNQYSLANSLRALEELVRFDGGLARVVEFRRALLRRHRELYSGPDLGMTWEQLEEKLNPGLALGGLLGLAAYRVISAPRPLIAD
jgi:hypothetical protein